MSKLLDLNVNPVFDVTDGPSGIKYIAYFKFLTKYYESGRSADFQYMNFPYNPDVIDHIISLLKNYCDTKDIRYFVFNKSIFGVNEDFFFNCGYGDEEGNSVYQVEMSGLRTAFVPVFDILKHKEFKIKKKDASINWFFRGSNGAVTSKTIRFDKNPDAVKDCYYPYIKTEKGGVKDYMKEFLNSKSSILVMIGPPGTGKTSLVRDFIHSNKIKTYMTFDESIISDDGFFVNFMTEKDADLLVVEDADLLIASRESENNKLMAKFLNIGDGLVKHQNKKLIFTTNLSNVNKIDEALVREGRCHGVVQFRNLTLDEANEVRFANKLPVLTEDKPYPLSKIFNENRSNIRKTKVGIV